MADIPSTTLSSASPTIRESFCTLSPASALCPDGASLRPTSLDQVGSSLIANGNDTYTFTMKLRDRYGNAITEGQIRVDYTDRVRTLQVDPSEYGEYILDACPFGTCALLTTGDLMNSFDGMPTTGDMPSTDISYTISAIAPTSAGDSLSLS